MAILFWIDASAVSFLCLYACHASGKSTENLQVNPDGSPLRVRSKSGNLVRRDGALAQIDLNTDSSRFDAESQTQMESSITSDYFPKSVSQYLVGLNYVFPSSSAWDAVHDGHTSNDGGVWNYGGNVKNYLEVYLDVRHPAYNSAWDVACNIGYFLKRLAAKHPSRQYFGSDISSVMVNSTRSECSRCVADVFDIGQLQYPNTSPPHIHEPVDLIIVADVLNYMSWGGLPPIFNAFYPPSLVRHHQVEFMRQLTQLARKEVIFTSPLNKTDPQTLPARGVLRFMDDMKIECVVRAAGFGIWVAKGTAGNAKGWAPPPELQGLENAIMEWIFDIGRTFLWIFCSGSVMMIVICFAYRPKAKPVY